MIEFDFERQPSDYMRLAMENFAKHNKREFLFYARLPGHGLVTKPVWVPVWRVHALPNFASIFYPVYAGTYPGGGCFIFNDGSHVGYSAHALEFDEVMSHRLRLAEAGRMVEIIEEE